MPLTAYHRKKDQIICILDYENPKYQLDCSMLECPTCEGNLFIRSPETRVMHFCHYPGQTAECKKLGETVRHAVAKMQVARMIARRDEYRAEVRVEQEIGDRRADVLVTYEQNHTVAHEIQLSEIPYAQVRRRSLDYFNNGAAVHWWYGPEIPESTKEKTIRDLGGCTEIEFSAEAEEEETVGKKMSEGYSNGKSRSEVSKRDQQ